jgi:hypothetical protein
MTTVSFTEDGSIKVQDAPLPFMHDYVVGYGDVYVPTELAEEGKKYSWRLVGKEEEFGLVIVSRTLADWIRCQNALPDV